MKSIYRGQEHLIIFEVSQRGRAEYSYQVFANEEEIAENIDPFGKDGRKIKEIYHRINFKKAQPLVEDAIEYLNQGANVDLDRLLN